MDISKLSSWWKGGVWGVLIAFFIFLAINLIDLFLSLPQGCSSIYIKSIEGESVRNCFRNGAVSFVLFIPLYIIGFFLGAYIGKKSGEKNKT